MPYDGPAGADDAAVAIAKDVSSNIFVAGISNILGTATSIGGPIYTLIKYTQTPGFELSQREITCGSVDVSCSSEEKMMIRNPGAGALIISSIVSDDLNFKPGTTKAVVPPKDSLELTVRFAPLTPGLKSGAVTLTHDGPDSPDTVSVTGSGIGDGTEITLHNSFSKGWQLISLPLEVQCPFVMPVLFEYDNGYLHNDTMNIGRAYWRKFDEESEVYMTGKPTRTDTFEIKAGWNLIGSKAVALPIANVSTIPGTLSSFIYGYSGGYSVADSIEPERGYWMKASQDGKLILWSGSQSRPKGGPDLAILSASSVIKFLDASGGVQKLYFSGSRSTGVDAARYELPPAVPEGGFDVRFASNRLLEVIDGKGEGEYPIKISATEYPVNVSWEMKGGEGNAILIVGGREVKLGGMGTVKICREEAGKVILKITGSKGLPKEYALEQNYPNPFNPSTTIKYQLPFDSKVSLRVYDMLGRVVAAPVEGLQQASYQSMEWNASSVASGIYFYRLEATSITDPGQRFTSVKKMMLLK